MISRDRMASLMLMMSVGFRAELSEPLLEAYYYGLSDVPDDALETGCHRALREWRYSVMPSVSELRRFAGFSITKLPEWKPERSLPPSARGWPQAIEGKK